MLTRCVVLVVFALLPAVAGAQSTDPPRVSIGAGAGLALPLHGDFDFTPWAWETDVRVALSRRGLLEVAAGEWRHSESRVARDIQVTPPPGAIGRFEQTTDRSQRMLQVNLLFRGTTGPLRVTAGGGGAASAPSPHADGHLRLLARSAVRHHRLDLHECQRGGAGDGWPRGGDRLGPGRVRPGAVHREHACMRKLLTILNAMMRTNTQWLQSAELPA